MIYSVCAALAAHGRAHPAALPVLLRAAIRLRGYLRSLLVLMTALAAGRLPVPAARRPGGSKRRPSVAQAVRLGGRGWLLRLVPSLADGYARVQLEHLLERPQVQALLAAAPREAARVLRPLCTALDVRLPDALRRRRGRERPPVEAEPAAPSAAPPARAASPPSCPRDPARSAVDRPARPGARLRSGPAYG